MGLGLLLLQSPAYAGAAEVPDASCPGPRESNETNNGSHRFAQTFTAQHTGTLTSAVVALHKEGTAGNWVFDILNVDGTGTPIDGVLASTTVLDSAVAAGDTDVPVTFTSPASVVAGQQYAIVVSRPGGTEGIGKRNGDDCAGQAFESSLAPGTFSAAGQTGADLVFSAFVTPIPRLLTVQKAGAGTGAVTATGIDCGVDCDEIYDDGVAVVLTATPAAGSTFGGWSGCDTPSGNSCTMTMTADRLVLATFNLAPSATPPSPGNPPSGTAPTGQRAAALAKCNKKSKKKRKKCRKRALLLPV